MKYKNYKSAIHNFSHSFISIDYTKSGKQAINVLIDLHNLGKETRATFDFINKTIQPKKADSIRSKQLLNDYLNWLPEHFKNHNCDLEKLEKLEITFWSDFNEPIESHALNNTIEFKTNVITKWKANNKNEEIIEISQTELIKPNFLKIGISEL